MVWSTFKSYYRPCDAAAWVAWDPKVDHRGVKKAKPGEVINITQVAAQYRPPAEVSGKLNEIVTSKIYSHLITADEKLDENFLKKHKFVVLKNSSTRVLVNQELTQWIIKVGAGATRDLCMEGPVKAALDPDAAYKPLRNSNLLRASGREFLVKQLKELDKETSQHFEVPEEYLFQSKHAKINAPLHQKYFTISKKKEVYSGKETVAFLKELGDALQRQIAKKIVLFINKTRMHDLHRGNLVLSKNAKTWCFQIIDTEPIGLMIDSEDTGAHLFNPVEHVLVALIHFRDIYCRANGLIAMAEELDVAIVDYMAQHKEIEVTSSDLFLDPLPATSMQKAKMVAFIVISIICPLIPIILFIVACFVRCCTFSQSAPYEHVRDTPIRAQLLRMS